MTLRQIEVIRAVMVTGTINGAARLLNVSAPGISRLVKHAERALNLRFFHRQNGRFVPTPEARSVFEQIDGVYQKLDDLGHTLSALTRGGSSELKIGSVPSISHVMVPRAIAHVRRHYPALRMDVSVLKIEEVLNYLLLGKGECVATSDRFDHPGIEFDVLATGELLCIVPEHHALASRSSIGAAEISRHPLIGIDPGDPHGRIVVGLFDRLKLGYDVPIKARFGSMVCALVEAGLGIAVIDRFTLAHHRTPGIKALRIEEPTQFQTYVAVKRGAPLSIHAECFIRHLRAEMSGPQPETDAQIKRSSGRN